MASVPYKSDQVVKDIMAQTQAKVLKKVAAALKPQEDARKSRGKKKRNIDNDAVLDLEEPAGLFDVADLSDDDSEEGADGQKIPKKGELYKQLWNRIKYKTRQVKTVYMQIGLDPD